MTDFSESADSESPEDHPTNLESTDSDYLAPEDPGVEHLHSEYLAEEDLHEYPHAEVSDAQQSTPELPDSPNPTLDCPDPHQRVVSDPFHRGRMTVPFAIEDLGSKGVDLITVAILRFIWRYGRSGWARVHQPALAKDLNISVRTAQRHLKAAQRERLIEFQQSSRKPKDRGYLCEYRINWRRVFAYYNWAFEPQRDLKLEDLQWVNAMKAKALPYRFFSNATLKGKHLHLVTRDDETHVLPGDDYQVLKYVAEAHYGRQIPEDSLDTFVNIAGRLTPRLLSLFSFALASIKKIPDSPGYYTRILQRNREQAMGPPKKNKTRTPHRAVPTIKITVPDQE